MTKRGLYFTILTDTSEDTSTVEVSAFVTTEQLQQVTLPNFFQIRVL